MFSKDTHLTFNFNDPFSPHSIVLGLVKDKSLILDVGCNTGYIGKYLIKKKDCQCDGVDYNKQLLNKAKKNGYRHIYAIDLYSNNFHLPFRYDTILLIDILEHLPNPYIILKKLVKENLKRRGEVIICLPNIGRIEYRIKHLLGQFDYEASGIMHQDHLRFFTQKTARKLINKSGLKINKILPTGLGSRLKIFPDLTAFQFIFITKKI